MCYNADISIKTFLFGLISAIIIYLIDSKYLPYILMIMSFTSMQLLEYFAWTYINNEKIIKFLSYIGFLLIYTQVIFLNYFLLPKKYKTISAIIITIGAIILYLFNDIKFTMTKSANGHLRWHWIEVPLIWVILTLCLYLIPIYDYNIYLFFFVYILLIISIYNFYKDKTFGSIWCYFSNLLWIIFLISILFDLNITNKNNR